jgi:hypothetical protein
MIFVLTGKEDLEMTLTNTGRGNPEGDTCAQWEGSSRIGPHKSQPPAEETLMMTLKGRPGLVTQSQDEHHNNFGRNLTLTTYIKEENVPGAHPHYYCDSVP